MGAYKRDTVVVIQLGAYIHRVLTSMGTYYPDSTVSVIYHVIVSHH